MIPNKYLFCPRHPFKRNSLYNKHVIPSDATGPVFSYVQLLSHTDIQPFPQLATLRPWCWGRATEASCPFIHPIEAYRPAMVRIVLVNDAREHWAQRLSGVLMNSVCFRIVGSLSLWQTELNRY